MKKNVEKEKASIERINLEMNLIKKENKEKYIKSKENEYIVKEIAKDGNCFYFIISYYFQQKEDNYKEFSEFISEYIIINLEKYMVFFCR